MFNSVEIKNNQSEQTVTRSYVVAVVEPGEELVQVILERGRI